MITGANGSGKTNLLEAISLLAPGRGLRGAALAELPRRGGDGAWGVAAQLAGDGAATTLGTGMPVGATGERRQFRLDGAAPRSHAEIAQVFAVVWLTPQMDRLFLEGASGRRRFLDRLVWALEPGHARETAAHDRVMLSRNRLLAQPGADASWLAALEDGMARHAVAASAARAALVERLNGQMGADAGLGAFPRARLALSCSIAERLASLPAIAVEDWLRDALAARRGEDAAAGRAGLGAHRADMVLSDRASGLPASAASTGQQKALLVATILCHAALIAERRGAAPLLLLDEPLVHLDAERRGALFAALAGLPGQALLTGTDAADFGPLRGVAEGWLTGGDGMHRQPGWAS